MNERFDVVIVGAGLAGLGCATRLAREGFSVQVLERSSRIGGRALSAAVGGIPMNLGAHALFLGGPAERWLASLGVPWTGFRPKGTDKWLSDGGDVFAFPTSLVSLLAAKAFSLGERVSLMRFFATLDRLPSNAGAGWTVAQWLDRIAAGPRARRFLEMLVRVSTYSNAPDVLPAEHAIRQLQRTAGPHAKGVAYLDDGWQTLVAGAAARAREAGANIATGVNVQRVADDGSLVLETGETMVGADDGSIALETGETMVGRQVILAVPYGAARAMYPALAAAPPRIKARAACLDMTLDASPKRRLVFGLDEPHYFSVHAPVSQSAPLRAHAHRYLAPDEVGAECRAPLDAWLDRVAPDVRPHILAARFLPEMEVTSGLPGCASASPRPARVAFAGDWVSTRFMLLDAVAESAEAAVSHTIAAARKRSAA